MKKYVITVDGGTTNTRLVLWNEKREKIAEAAREVGARNTSSDGNNDKLKEALKSCFDEVLKKAGITASEVSRIIGSGMMTSEAGLCAVPWITAPAGRKELAQNVKEVLFPEIAPVPFTLIPGIKNSPDLITEENISDMDIMRGEETECIAVLSHLKAGEELLLVLPGSHNKFIPVNREGQILGCITSISGELLSAVTRDTILAKSVNRSFVKPGEYDRGMVLEGFRTARKQGLGKACFNCRLLMLFTENDASKIANYLLGASLSGDVQAVRNSEAFSLRRDTRVVVCGREPLRNAVRDVLTEDGYFTDVTEYVPDGELSLSAEGQYLIMEEMK